MSPTALGLVLGAGVLHATWNLILKGSTERLATSAWALVVAAVLFAPTVPGALPIPGALWPYVAASAAALVAYYTCLAWAYEQGDFSLVYPIARGTAPAMLAVWAAIFLGERPAPGGIGGIAIILAGLVVLGGAPVWSGKATLSAHSRGMGPAFLVAFLISVYSAIDGAAVRLWSPVPYLVLVFALSGVVLIPILRVREGHRVFRVWRTSGWRIVAIAVLTLSAYAMVLRAFQLAPVSYAGAAREISIVFGALAGWIILGERFGGIRTAGALLVFIGIGVLAVVG